MEQLDRLEAVAVPIATANIDTDQILPARFLQKPRSDDFGRYLFHEFRFGQDGSEVEDFVLNRPRTGRRASSSPSAISAAAPRASTRSGRSTTTASVPSSRRASATSSWRTA